MSPKYLNISWKSSKCTHKAHALETFRCSIMSSEDKNNIKSTEKFGLAGNNLNKLNMLTSHVHKSVIDQNTS